MPGGRRTNADEQLLLALACGSTAEQAAAKAGVGVRTVFRRLEDAGFAGRLREMKADMVRRAAAALTAAAMEGVKTLLELMKPSNTGPVRLGAARAILEMGVKLREMAELEERLAALEERVGQGTGAGR
jgi:hypothetical protein